MTYFSCNNYAITPYYGIKHGNGVIVMRLGGVERKIHNAGLKKRYAVLCIFLLLAAFSAWYVCFKIRPVFVKSMNMYIDSFVSGIINESITECFAASGADYENLVKTTMGKNGEITSVQTDIIKLNKLSMDIANSLQGKISLCDRGTIPIPLGVILGNELFAGFGPDIEIAVITSGDTDVCYDDSFTATGINQTLHQIFLDIQISINTVAGYVNVEKNTDTRVLVAETVIVGAVPDYYSDSGRLGLSGTLGATSDSSCYDDKPSEAADKVN